MTDWTDLDPAFPDDDPVVVAGMQRLAELRELEREVIEFPNVRPQRST